MAPNVGAQTVDGPLERSWTVTPAQEALRNRMSETTDVTVSAATVPTSNKAGGADQLPRTVAKVATKTSKETFVTADSQARTRPLLSACDRKRLIKPAYQSARPADTNQSACAESRSYVIGAAIKM